MSFVVLVLLRILLKCQLSGSLTQDMWTIRMDFHLMRGAVYKLIRFRCTTVGVATATFKDFDSHWHPRFVNKMLNMDELIEGRILFVAHNTAYVINPVDGGRVLITNRNINRALPNDIVAVKLNDVLNWRVASCLENEQITTVCSFPETSPVSRPLIPAEEEEQDEAEQEAEEGQESSKIEPELSVLSVNHFKLANPSTRQPKGQIIYPRLSQVLQRSPQLFSQIFPNEQVSSSSPKELPPHLRVMKPLTSLPSQYLQRTGRVVCVLSKSSKRLIGSLEFQIAPRLPSAFISAAEEVNEFEKPQLGKVNGNGQTPFEAPLICFFKSERPHVPTILLSPSSVPEDLWQNPDKAVGVQYVCEVQDWLQNSCYPNGVLCDKIGDPFDIEPATSQILINHGIIADQFSPEMLNDLPSSVDEFKISNYEYLRRKDFRSYCTVSVDPSTAKDLDDALHVRKISADVYEVGVHIADVSFFVRPHSPLDFEAANRTTSTYLVQRVIPMLPSILSEHLCSLNPGSDRLAFSVVFKVDKNGQILHEWIGRTIIRSCARLSYEDAFDLLYSSKQKELESRLNIHGPFSLANVRRSIKYLSMLAKQMRTKRIENGALLLDKVELEFDLVPKTVENTSSSDAHKDEDVKPGWPRGYRVKQRGDGHYMIEEWMLAANQAVARRLFSEAVAKKKRDSDLETASKCSSSDSPSEDEIDDHIVPLLPAASIKSVNSRTFRSSKGTILRRHPAPKENKMNDLVQLTKAAAISMDTSSGAAMRNSIEAYTVSLKEKGLSEDEINSLSTALSYLTYMRMQMALYFNVEDLINRALRLNQKTSNSAKTNWESALVTFSHHFGLNVPLYTHFTSPIRRYADLLVHRQLADILNSGYWSCPRSNPTPYPVEGSPAFQIPRRLTVQAAWCNRMRSETRRAQEESQQLFLAAIIKASGSITENAVILSFGEAKVQILVPSTGLIINQQLTNFCKAAKKWHITRDTSSNVKGSSKQNILKVFWSAPEGVDENGKMQEASSELKLISVWPCRLFCSAKGFFIQAELLPPTKEHLSNKQPQHAVQELLSSSSSSS